MVGEAAVTQLSGAASQALRPPVSGTMVLPPRVPHEGADHSHHQWRWLSAYTELRAPTGLTPNHLQVMDCCGPAGENVSCL